MIFAQIVLLSLILAMLSAGSFRAERQSSRLLPGSRKYASGLSQNTVKKASPAFPGHRGAETKTPHAGVGRWPPANFKPKVSGSVVFSRSGERLVLSSDAAQLLCLQRHKWAEVDIQADIQSNDRFVAFSKGSVCLLSPQRRTEKKAFHKYEFQLVGKHDLKRAFLFSRSCFWVVNPSFYA